MTAPLPHSLEYEQSFLSACLNGYAKDALSTGLTADQLYRTAHQKIYGVIVSLEAELIDATLTTVVQKARDEGILDDVGGASYIAKLIDAPVPGNLSHCANVIKDKALRRYLIEKFSTLTEDCYNESDSIKLISKFKNIGNSVCLSSKLSSIILSNTGFRLFAIGEIQSKAPQWVIKGFAEKDSTIDIFGDPGVTKTFVAIDMTCSIATARPWHGREIKNPGLAIYIAGEGQNGLSRRFKAWCIRNGVDYRTLPVFISRIPAALCDPEQTAQVISEINNVAEKHGPPAVIVIDTVARNFGPGDENSTADMTAFIGAIDRIRETYRCLMLLVHHSGIADKTRGRGNSALKGAVDAEYRMSKDKDGIIYMEPGKPPKDFEAPPPMAFKIRQVELGFNDEDGNPVTSAVLDSIEYQPAGPSGKQARGQNQLKAISILEKMHEERRQNKELGGYSPEGARVQVAEWRQAMEEAGIKRNRIYEVITSLEKSGCISIDGVFVILPD